MRVVYVDTLFITNLVINYLTLLATAKICAASVRRLRIAVGAIIGGIYAVLAALPPLEFLKSPIIIAAVGVILVVAAFGGNARIFRITVVFFVVSAAFAGVVMAISLLSGGDVTGGYFVPINLRTLVLSFAVCYAVMTVVFRRTAGNKGLVKKLTVRQGGNELTLSALVDTGNTLRDPLTGEKVVITGVTEGKKLLPASMSRIVGSLGKKDAVTIMEEVSELTGAVRFQLIPYSAVGIAGGMLLAFRADEVWCEGVKNTGMLIALSPNDVSDNGTYTALIGA